MADARQLRDDARKEVRAGRDPTHDRKMGKIAAKVSAGNSFKSVAEDFIATKLVANGNAGATIDKARWFLSHLTPALGSRPIAEIEPAELLAVLKRIEQLGHRETARRTRALASRIFRYGVATIRYIYSTFPIVERQELATHGSYRSRDLALAYINTLMAGQPDAEVTG